MKNQFLIRLKDQRRKIHRPPEVTSPPAGATFYLLCFRLKVVPPRPRFFVVFVYFEAFKQNPTPVLKPHKNNPFLAGTKQTAPVSLTHLLEIFN